MCEDLHLRGKIELLELELKHNVDLLAESRRRITDLENQLKEKDNQFKEFVNKALENTKK